MSYSLVDTLAGKRLVVVGGTGFLGKVWLSLILGRFPQIDHIFLVVRPKAGQGVVDRFLDKVIGAEVFDPLRAELGAEFADFVASKVTPMAGDVSMPLCGIDAEFRSRMRGTIDAVVNVAGIVDFAPPLDEALIVNAFGCQNLLALARDVGTTRVLHTSTCYTAGSRTGPIAEVAPTVVPFPKAHELDVRDWSAEREIDECLEVIEQARQRADDAFRQSAFLDQAKKNLLEREEPTIGVALQKELAKVRRKFIEAQLSALGTERARYWGWPNTYTYTKSIGEQIIATSGLDYTIVRPAIVESTLEYPFPGWNEGINTSAPFIFLIRQGGLQVPGSNNNLDFIPCDLVCSAITLALGELIDGSQKPVYQAASSDTNPCTMARFFELSGLHKRKYYQRTGRGGPLLARLQEHYESALLSKKEYETAGPKQLAAGAEWLCRRLNELPLHTPELERGLLSFAKQQRRLAHVMDTFLPFVAEYQYIFETKVTRAAYQRLSAEERRLVPFEPGRIDWRDWFMKIHAPALENRVFPLMEERLAQKARAPEAFESLNQLFVEACKRFAHHPLFQVPEQDGLGRLSYEAASQHVRGLIRELRVRGVGPSTRVALSGPNEPAWCIAFFAILGCGAMAVPLDPSLTSEERRLFLERSKAKLLIASGEICSQVRKCRVTIPSLAFEKVFEFTSQDEAFFQPPSEHLAVLLFTSSDGPSSRGVLLSHHNLASAVASLGSLFALSRDDRLVSVSPLHLAFELTCGLLLPLSRGATITYVSEPNGPKFLDVLRASRATTLVGVPAFWQGLETLLRERARRSRVLGKKRLELTLEGSRFLSRTSGIGMGRALFGAVHGELGGQLRNLLSVGVGLPLKTHAFFQALGLFVSKGYALPEAGSVISFQEGNLALDGAAVGQAVPGVELKISEPNADGVGQLWVRSPSIMRGYLDDDPATRSAIAPDGWLNTGELGRLDSKGRLSIVGDTIRESRRVGVRDFRALSQQT